MSMSRDQHRLQQTQEQIQAEIHTAPIEEEQQPATLVLPLHERQQAEPFQLETEENALLVEQIHQQLPAVHAEVSAPGAPVQEEVPAKMSWKERRREKKHADAARKACPVGNAAAYDMVKQISTLNSTKENAIRDFRALADRQHVDKRVLKVFSIPYQVNKKGQPVSKADAAAKQRSDAFIQDYCSNDLQRRRPHLDRMVNELLAIQYSPDMFSHRNLRKNAAQLKEWGDKMVYMDNVMKDPVNRPYFDRMDPVRRGRLEAAFQTLYNPFVGAMTIEFQKNGVEINEGRYYGYEETIPIEMGQAMSGQMQADFQTALDRMQLEEASIAARQVTRVRDCAQDYARRMGENAAALERVKADPRLGLRPGEESSAYLTRTVMLLKPGEEHQEENLETVRTCLELGRVGTNARPTPALYQRARDMLAPRVQRVLDCDVEHFAQMDDEALLTCAPELNGLFMDNMFVADLMKLQHPYQSWNNRVPITLKDDLVGQRGVEYSYKLSLLRGLADRAKGLALQRQSQAGPLLAEDYLAAGERNALAGKTVEQFAAERLELGTRQIKAAKAKYKALTTPGTQEFKARIADLVTKGAQQLTVYDMKFQTVEQELWQRGTPELEQVISRVKDRRYFSLAHSREELQNRGLPQDIGEPIFRSFSPTATMEATSRLMSGEDFRQMVLDLGAGGDLTYETATKEQREAAVAQNARGLAAYKRIVRAQFDMLERKYGDKLERVSIQELCEHFGDLARDFCNVQVILNMATKHPDFLNPDDPEDQLLLQQVNYYSILGNAALSGVPFIMGGVAQTDAELAQTIARSLSTEPSFTQAAAYLKANRQKFQKQAIEWNQKVRLPVEDVGDAAGRFAQDTGAMGAFQIVSDLLREEDPEGVVAEQVLKEARQAEEEIGPDAVPLAAAYAAEQALRHLRDRSITPPPQ